MGPVVKEKGDKTNHEIFHRGLTTSQAYCGKVFMNAKLVRTFPTTCEKCKNVIARTASKSN